MENLSLSREFSFETQMRSIDNCQDMDELKRVAKSLLSAWQLQSDMTRHYGAQALGINIAV